MENSTATDLLEIARQTAITQETVASLTGPVRTKPKWWRKSPYRRSVSEQGPSPWETDNADVPATTT